MAKIYSLGAGSKLPEDLLAIASKERIATALLSGIGGVRELTLAYFNKSTKAYEKHRFEEDLEVTSLLGNITLKEGKPYLHIHGNFGRRDLSLIGGHVDSAVVSPLLEVVLTPTRNRAVRTFDSALGLNVIRGRQILE